MDSTSDIPAKEVETKSGTEKEVETKNGTEADVNELAPEEIDNKVEILSESDSDSDLDKSVTQTSGEEGADIKTEVTKTGDCTISSDPVETVTLTTASKSEEPGLVDTESSSTDEIDESAEIESTGPKKTDLPIPTPQNPANIKIDNPTSVSEENTNDDNVDDNVENSSAIHGTSDIEVESEKPETTEDTVLQESSIEEESNEPTTNVEDTEIKEVDPDEHINESQKLGNKSDIIAKNVNDNENSRLTQSKETELLDKTTNENANLKTSDQNVLNTQILDIISDIDINIKAQEKITQLKEQELQLIKKQNELTNQIHQQQILALQLNEQNQFQQSQSQEGQNGKFDAQSHNRSHLPISTPPQKNTAFNEPTHSSKTVDLRKIFTPATDAPEILPKNRKLYSSSAFYSPTLHPTVEDQVELARRISHSLSDISNQTSKGQSMYVNRKKRSDKWVHEGRSQGNECLNDAINQLKENSDTKSTLECKKLEKIPLRLLMNPNGKVHDYNSLKELINTKTGLLSPDNCAELITALQLQQGKGAELFAKRRKKAENWVVDEANTGTLNHPSGIPDYQQYQQKPAISPNILPAYSDAGKHRVQLNIHQNQLIEKYAKPGVQVVVSPWEAALQTGSASSAFLENTKSQCDPPSAVAPPLYFPGGNKDFTDAEEPRRSHDLKQYNKASGSQAADVLSNPQRDLAYTPCVAQGWGGRSVELPKGLYVPKEISLSSYAAPSNQYAVQEKRVEAPRYESSPHPFPKTNFPGESSYGTINNTAFPASKPLATGYTTLPPQRQLYSPSSYQKSQVGSENFKPQVNFNPSPLSFDKLARYEQPDKGCSVGGGPQYLNAQQNLHVGNASPVPFDVGYNKVTSTSPSSIGSMGSSNRNLSRTDYFRSGPAPSSLVTRPTSHDQSFNKCARGWGTLPGQQQNYQSQHSYPSAGNLPYSDF